MEIKAEITVTFSLEEYHKLSDLVSYIANGNEPDLQVYQRNSLVSQTLVEIAKDLNNEWEYMSP